MSVKSVMLIILGFMALLIGIVGVFVPIMPTTPFVLVSAACFGNSSPRLYNKLLNNKHFGEFVDNYKNKSGITTTARIKSMVFLWITLTVSAVIFGKMLVTTILLVVGIAVSTHILLIKVKK